MPKYTYREQKISTKTIAKIASQVMNSKIPKLMSRKYHFVNYEPQTNLFLSDGINDLIHWEGTLCPLHVIDKQDVEFITNENFVDLVQTAMEDEQKEAAVGGGLGRGMVDTLADGFRDTDTVYIHSINVLMRVRARALKTTLTNNISTIPDNFEKVRLRYSLVLWRGESEKIADGADLPIMLNPLYNPDPISLLKWLPFGYSAKLDTGVSRKGDILGTAPNLEAKYNEQKVRTLARGECTVRFTSTKTDEKYVRIYKSFDKPLALNFNPEHQQGTRPLNWRIYLVLRSQVPNTPLFQPFMPSVHAVSKVRYVCS